MKAIFLILMVVSLVWLYLFPDHLKYLTGGWCAVGIYHLTTGKNED